MKINYYFIFNILYFSSSVVLFVIMFIFYLSVFECVMVGNLSTLSFA